jgi:hypothetical protein
MDKNRQRGTTEQYRMPSKISGKEELRSNTKTAKGPGGGRQAIRPKTSTWFDLPCEISKTLRIHKSNLPNLATAI